MPLESLSDGLNAKELLLATPESTAAPFSPADLTEKEWAAMERCLEEHSEGVRSQLYGMMIFHFAVLGRDFEIPKKQLSLLRQMAKVDQVRLNFASEEILAAAVALKLAGEQMNYDWKELMELQRSALYARDSKKWKEYGQRGLLLRCLGKTDVSSPIHSDEFHAAAVRECRAKENWDGAAPVAALWKAHGRHIELIPSDWDGMKKRLYELADAGLWYSYSRNAAHMAILAAKTVSINEQGVALTFIKSRPTEDIHALPAVRKFYDSL